MKVYFGFNDIKPDGMGTAAMNLLSSLQTQKVDFQTVHPWREVEVPEFMRFSPVFLSEERRSPDIRTVIKRMIDVVNNDQECNIFSHFGSPNWGCIVPYLRPDIKVVVSVHSVTPSALKIALANRERTSLFVPVSPGVETKLRAALPPTDHSKIMPVSNAVDISLYNQRDGKMNTPPRILYIGRIEDVTKGCDKIPRIANILKKQGVHFQWDLYGYFHWGYEKKFFSQLARNDVEDCVHYKGCLSPNELREIIPEYDVMVMPSNHEGFGLSLLDAMASKVPCVASDLSGSTSTIIENGKSGLLVSRNDLAGFADKISSLVNNSGLAKEIGEAGYMRTMEKFDLLPHGEQYKKVFERALLDNTCFTPEKFDAGNFRQPEALKPHILARLLPLSIKKVLKKII